MVNTAPGAEAPPMINPTIFALPPERQLSIQSAGFERQLSTQSGPSAKCFPVEYMIENGYFTAPVVHPPTVSLRRKVCFQSNEITSPIIQHLCRKSYFNDVINCLTSNL